MRRCVARSAPWHRGKSLQVGSGCYSWRNEREATFELKRLKNVVNEMLAWTRPRNLGEGRLLRRCRGSGLRFWKWKRGQMGRQHELKSRDERTEDGMEESCTEEWTGIKKT